MAAAGAAPRFERPGRGVTRLVLKVLLSVSLGYLMSVYLTRVDVQDALQYRTNLETGAYDDPGPAGAWQVLVLGLFYLLPSLDPFALIGAAIAALFLFAAARIEVDWMRWAAFLLMLCLPLMALNYGQVLRQGLAAALIVQGLLTRRSALATGLLVLGALLHLVYAPFVALLLVREWFVGNGDPAGDGARPSSRQVTFDTLVCLGIGLAIAGVLWLGPRAVVEKYFEFDRDNIKRVFVALLMLSHVVLVYPVSASRLSVFTTYLGVMVALSLPFQVDYTRVNTALFPFLLFSALTCPRRRLSFYALFVCLVLSGYVGLRLQYN